MAILAALLLGLATGAPRSALEPSGRNSVADQIAQKSLALGIDFDEILPSEVEAQTNPDALRPDPAQVKAFSEAELGAWVSAQIQIPGDKIGEPPAALREWLEGHSETLLGVVAALEKDAPEWKTTGEERKQKPSMPFLAIIRLEKVLLALALSEERRGESVAAGSALEASWSLGKSVGARPRLLDQLIATAIEKLQAGVLRKIQNPPLQWMGRLGGEGTLGPVLDAIAEDFHREDSALADSSDPWVELSRKFPQAIGDTFRKRSPCEASLLSEDQINQIVDRELSVPSSTELAEIRKIGISIVLPNILNAVRRAARLAVDRELTLKVLELRLDRATSRANEWPERLSLDVSSVCPEATYAYRRDGPAMWIRFEGSVAAPEGGPILPLFFDSGPPPATSVPTPTPRPAEPPPLTPPAPGGMIPPR